MRSHSIETMNPAIYREHNGWILDLLFLSLLFTILYFLFLDARPLFVPDEGRYAEIAREMVARGDYITPHLNDIKYFEKPILFYWLCALMIKLCGASIWAVRSINAALAVIGCLYTYFTARLLYNRTVGLWSALILGTSTLYFVMGHMVSLDLGVSFFLLVFFYSFLLSLRKDSYQNYYLYLSVIASAAAVLTKGLIGVVFPIMIVLCWCLLLGRWSVLKRYGIRSLLLFTILVAPWHLLSEYFNPGFSYFLFRRATFSTLYHTGHWSLSTGLVFYPTAPLWFLSLGRISTLYVDSTAT